MDEAITHFENSSKNKTTLTRASTAPISQSSSQPNPTIGSSLVQTKSMNAVSLPTEPILPVSQPASTPANQIYKVNLLIPETLSKSEKDLYISVRVTAIQTLQDICRGIRPHLINEDIWFSLHDESDQEQERPDEIPFPTKISLISTRSSTSEFTLLVHSNSSRTIELTVNCLNKRGAKEQSIKLIVKPTQTCRKMIEKISAHVGAPQSSCTFTFQGKKVKSTDTFQSLKIVNGSEIIMKKK
jgi:hypothetical protein